MSEELFRIIYMFAAVPVGLVAAIAVYYDMRYREETSIPGALLIATFAGMFAATFGLVLLPFLVAALVVIALPTLAIRKIVERIENQ